MIKSSANRLMCTIVKLAQNKNSAIKSRSLTPYNELLITPLKPSSLAINSRSTVNGFPARAPEPRGKTLRRSMICSRRCASACQPQA